VSADQGRYTLAELAAASGVSPRTIRYYTAEGLLPPPSERGRYAIYSDEHLRRLQLIDRLKAAYLPLAAIREQLAAPANTQAPPGQQRLPPPPHEPAPATGFGFRVSAALGDVSVPFSRFQSQSPTSGYAALFPYPEDDPAAGAPESEERGELWQRILLAPGIELHVRAPIGDQQRERLDRLIAEARALFGDRSANERE